MYVCLSIQKQNNISTVGTALFSTRNFTDFFLLPFHYPYYKSYKTTVTSTELIVIVMANA